MTQPSAGLLDHSSDVALLRPPVAAPGVELAVVRSEPRMFVLPAGHGIGLCPASAARFHGRPGICFVPSAGLPPITMCVAWRAGDTRPAVQHFVSLAAESGPQPDDAR